MNTLTDTLKEFAFIAAELLALFVVISTSVNLLLTCIPQEKLKTKIASANGIGGNVIAAFFGALTPFCACSTIPMTVGLLTAGTPFGATMSFLIASPLLNPIIIGMLGTLVGVKAMLIYFSVSFVCAVAFGLALEKFGMRKHVKTASLKATCGCACGNAKVPQTFMEKFKSAGTRTWTTLKPMTAYILIGAALGAVIHNYIPQELAVKLAGADNIFAVPAAAVLGIPLYIRAETALPIGLALTAKGMSIGTVIALVIGGAGMAIPEMAMLAGIFRKRLVAAIVAVVFLTAVISGYAFNSFSDLFPAYALSASNCSQLAVPA